MNESDENHRIGNAESRVGFLLPDDLFDGGLLPTLLLYMLGTNVYPRVAILMESSSSNCHVTRVVPCIGATSRAKMAFVEDEDYDQHPKCYISK